MLFKTNDVRQALSRITAKRNVNGLLKHIFRVLNFGEKLSPAGVGGGLGSESLSATTAPHGASSTLPSLVADQTNALGSLSLSSGRSTGTEDHAGVGSSLGSEGLGVTTAPHDEEDDEEEEDDDDALLLRRFCADQLEGKACKEKDSCGDFLSICEAFARENGDGCGEPGSHLVDGKMMHHVRRTCHTVVKRIPCQPEKRVGDPTRYAFDHDHAELRLHIAMWRRARGWVKKMAEKRRALWKRNANRNANRQRR
jgi:hypothetical protein